MQNSGKHSRFKLLYITMITFSLIVIFAGNVLASSITNGGFETGDLSGWDTFIPAGGSIIATNNPLSVEQFSMSPIEGNYFALIRSNSIANYYTALSQPFYASAGSKICGWAFFKTKDSYLGIYNDASLVVTKTGSAADNILFQESVSSVGDNGITPWKYWEYYFPASGTYTIEAKVANIGDRYNNSYIGIDDVKLITPAPVLSVPADITAEATGITTPVTLGEATADGILPLTITNDAPAEFPLGTTVVTWTAVDAYGNSASASQVVTIFDNTAPEITAAVEDGAEFTLNEPATFTWSASDGQSGLAAADCAYQSGAALDTSTVGEKTINITAVDNAGNTTVKAIKYYVRYSFIGLFSPVNPDARIYQSGSSIPVKFRLEDANGSCIKTATAAISYAPVDPSLYLIAQTTCNSRTIDPARFTGAKGPKAEVQLMVAETSEFFRFDEAKMQYIYNFSTAGFAAGEYDIKITLDDGTENIIRIILR